MYNQTAALNSWHCLSSLAYNIAYKLHRYSSWSSCLLPVIQSYPYRGSTSPPEVAGGLGNTRTTVKGRLLDVNSNKSTYSAEPTRSQIPVRRPATHRRLRAPSRYSSTLLSRRQLTRT